MADIIKLALKSECKPFFRGANALKRLSLAIDWTEEQKHDRALTDRFLKYSEVEEEVREDETLDVADLCYELNLLVNKVSDERIFRSIANRLGKIEASMWLNSLQDDTHLVPLAITIKKKWASFSLANPLLEALVQFGEKWAKGKRTLNDDQLKNWPALVDLLGESFKKRFGERITKTVADADMIVNAVFFVSNFKYMDLPRLVKDEHRNIQSAVEKSITEKDFDQLAVQDAILQSDKNGTFVPDTHISDVVRGPLNDLYWTEDDDERKVLLERVAQRFHVELTQTVTSGAEEKTEVDEAAEENTEHSHSESEEK